MDQDSVHMVVASKVPMLNQNDNAPPITKVVEGVEATIAPTTAKEKAQRRLKLKVRRALYAKSLLQAIEKSSEVLDQTFDRLQKLISQLEIHGESISQEDVNNKFLRSLSPEWNTHTIVWRNKLEIDTLSLDDLYKNLKIYEPEVKGASSSSANIQNVALVFSNSTNSTNEAVNTAHGVTTASTQATALNSTTIDNLSDAVICASFAKEMELRWQMAMLTMRARRFLKNTRRKLTVNGNETIGFDKVVLVETTTSNALMSCDGAGYDWSNQAEEGPTNFALMAYTSRSSNSE
ncbi:hypothetical protein Tco_1551764, partial [Tanacetum coccineum]